MDHLCYFCLVLLGFYARLFVDALWSPSRKGLTSLLSFVMSYCDVVTFPLVSLVRKKKKKKKKNFINLVIGQYGSRPLPINLTIKTNISCSRPYRPLSR